jgi:hypothetical protein
VDPRLAAETRGTRARLREYASASKIAEKTLAAIETQTIGSFSVSHPNTSATVERTMSVSDPPIR